MADHTHLKSGWLGDVPAPLADSILSLGSWVRVPAGEIVFRIGDEAGDLFGIASGSIGMHIAMNEHEQRVAHICGPGFWFGDFELVTGLQRIMEIDANEDLLLLRVTRTAFLEMAGAEPEIWRWIAVLAVQHGMLAMGAADDLMLASAEARVVALLLRLTGHRLNHPASPPLESIRITQQELAVAANLSRTATGTILRKLKRNGEIHMDYGVIAVRNPEALQARLM
ncbi:MULTISPECIES: Crp/Fnr family transcriptional regulator [unclassified Meridianimarinicoccus]|uniref:Crp/Fnr family transcriptional regulator n=1 Tax=unclassified Meridianimarinicoccus TaxID=2923344 RepID=UPI00186926BF|nr:Crp/Fnr family transcriptional regulator [Fluviibacterium sp. MJW13]